MSLTDPTSGAGYSFGEKLPSAHMTTIATQQPDALDANNGGSYTMTDDVIINTNANDWYFNGTGEVLFAADMEIDGAVVIDSGSLTFGTAAVFPQVTSQSVTKWQPLDTLANSNDRFVWDTTGKAWDQDDTTSAGGLFIPISNVPATGTLTQVNLYVDGNGGGMSHGSLPATMPAILVSYRSNGITLTESSPVTDPSPAVGNYEGLHSIDVTGLSINVANASNLLVVVAGETGANAVNGALRVQALLAQFTVTEIAP